MPVISAFTDHPTHPYVRVQVSWADLPSVEYAAVYRVDAETGECTPLRPYICYNGWELLLSCGQGTWWDTEAPFDRPFYYITTSTEAPCVPGEPLFLDTYSRTLADMWGSTETGTLGPLPYALSGGTVGGDYDVVGNRGLMTVTTENVPRTAAIDIGYTDFDIQVDASINVLSLVQAATTRMLGRFTDINNTYQAGVNWDPAGTVSIFIARLVGGVSTIITPVSTAGTYTPGTEWTLRFQGRGTTFKMKAWPVGFDEPDAWNLEVVDSAQPTLTSTRAGLFGRRNTGNTNPTVVFSFDNFRGVVPCAPCEVVTASTAQCTPEYIVSDLFNRTAVNSWSPATSGQLYTLEGGTNPGDYDVTPAGGGTHNLTSVNVYRISTINIGQPDQDITTVSRLPVASATGGSITQWVLGRYADSSNYYAAVLALTTTGDVTLTLGMRSAGVFSGLASATTVGTGHAANQPWNVRLQTNGTTIQAKAWAYGLPEPIGWISIIDATLAVGNSAGVASRLEVGNANAPLLSTFTYLTIADPDAPCELTTVTLPSDGRFWLKDPVRPCHDRPVPLCPTGAPVTVFCGGPGGILFIGMGPEVYPANSLSLRPMNRSRTLSATRPRGGAATALRLQTVTFTDRDDLLNLAAPGSPLLFQGPAEYGIPDRYMDIHDVQVTPALPDLRVQFRNVVLPYDTQDRPAGPTQGICGARVADICELYPTWADLAATGLSWADLVGGQASPASANPDARTWDDVQAEFADWNAVNTGGRTWTGLQEGD